MRAKVHAGSAAFEGRRDFVAQICNLPYRRVALGQALERRGALSLAEALQNSILRYGRVQLCATRLAPIQTASAGPARHKFPIHTRADGFTLIEVVISSALMAMILVTAYLCLSACINGRRLTEPRLEVIQNGRVAMALMSADLRNACPLDKNSELIGMQRTLGDIQADNLDFATHNYTPRHPREGDFCEESFYLDADPETGRISLWRRRNPRISSDPLSGGSKEEIAKGVRGLRFEYFDGLDWYGEWGDVEGKTRYSNRERANSAGMPEAVRITLWLDPNPAAKPVETAAAAVTDIAAKGPDRETKPEPPFVFQTVVRLDLASAAESESSSGSSGTTTPGATEPTQPTAAPGGNF